MIPRIDPENEKAGRKHMSCGPYLYDVCLSSAADICTDPRTKQIIIERANDFITKLDPDMDFFKQLGMTYADGFMNGAAWLLALAGTGAMNISLIGISKEKENGKENKGTDGGERPGD